MHSFRAILCFLVVSGFAASAFGGSTTSGTLSVNGKTVTYNLIGESTSGSSSERDGNWIVEAVVDNTTHTITVGADQLTWNKEQVRLNGFKNVEIVINKQDVTITVDGKVVIPRSDKQFQ